MMASRHAAILRTIPCLIGVCLLAFPAETKYAEGTGEPNGPGQIATAADLITLGDGPEDYDKHFLLTADIDLDPHLPGRRAFDKAVTAPDTDRMKSACQGTPFTNVFAGNQHAVSHLMIEGGGSLRRFGQLAARAEVRNLALALWQTVL